MGPLINVYVCQNADCPDFQGLVEGRAAMVIFFDCLSDSSLAV